MSSLGLLQRIWQGLRAVGTNEVDVLFDLEQEKRAANQAK
jgi:hypothetical protein